MGMGRPRKYATPEEAVEANRTLQKGRNEKNSEQRAKTQAETNARYLAKVPPEIKRKKWAKSQSAYREKKKKQSKMNIVKQVNTIPSKTDFVNQFRENQLKTACEIAEEF